MLLVAPWEAIYTVDEERTMSYADTLGFHDAIVRAYEQPATSSSRYPEARSKTGQPSSLQSSKPLHRGKPEPATFASRVPSGYRFGLGYVFTGDE